MGNFGHLEQLQKLFVCEHCGTCCKIGGRFKLSPTDADNIKAFLKSESGQGISLDMCVFGEPAEYYMFANSPQCPLLDRSTNLCFVHATKPGSCVRYPFLSASYHETVLQDIFTCRGAVRALSKYLAVELF